MAADAVRSTPRAILTGVLALVAGTSCGQPGEGAVRARLTVSSGLIAATDVVRISLFDKAHGFECRGVHGQRPPPLVPASVFFADAGEAELIELPPGTDRAVVVDMLDARERRLGVGCAEGLTIESGVRTELDIVIHEYPKIVALVPADGAELISPTVQPSVTFSLPMDPASVSKQTVRVLDESGEVIFSDIGVFEHGRDRTFLVEIPFGLAHGLRYRLEVEPELDGPRSAAGLPLLEGASANFEIDSHTAIDRDFSTEMVYAALDGACDCEDAIPNLVRVVRDLVAGDRFVFEDGYPHVVTRLIVSRGARPFRDCGLRTTVAGCVYATRRLTITVYDVTTPELPLLCQIQFQITFTVSDCFCAVEPCSELGPTTEWSCDERVQCTD